VKSHVRLILPRGPHAVEFSRAFSGGAGAFAPVSARFTVALAQAARPVNHAILRPPFYALQPGVPKFPPNDTAALRQDVDQFMAKAMADESIPGAVAAIGDSHSCKRPVNAGLKSRRSA
jgi:hypothetical protein